MQLSLFPKDIYLTRIDNEKLVARFYRMRIGQDLFGRAVLWREWGRIGSFGRLKISFYDCEGTAVSDLAVIAQSKHKSGYLMHTE